MIDAIWVDNLIKVFEYERRLYAQILEEAGKQDRRNCKVM